MKKVSAKKARSSTKKKRTTKKERTLSSRQSSANESGYVVVAKPSKPSFSIGMIEKMMMASSKDS